MKVHGESEWLEAERRQPKDELLSLWAKGELREPTSSAALLRRAFAAFSAAPCLGAVRGGERTLWDAEPPRVHWLTFAEVPTLTLTPTQTPALTLTPRQR